MYNYLNLVLFRQENMQGMDQIPILAMAVEWGDSQQMLTGAMRKNGIKPWAAFIDLCVMSVLLQ